MKKTTYLLLVFLLTLFYSCTVKIAPEEEKWNPYELGDTFSFENELGEIKTFEINRIVANSVKENVYAGNLSRKKENLVVFAKQTEPTNGEEFPLLSLQANIGDVAELGLLLAIPGQLEANFIADISSLTTNTQFKIGETIYENVLEVNPGLQVGEGVSTAYPLKLYFSKKIGFLGYDLNNGEKWRLR